MDKISIKHSIKTLVLFIIISFVADKVVFFTLNKISDEVYSGQSIGKLNHYLKIKDDLDFIVFGSSRANHNIDPNEVSENSFNMGVDGSKLSFSSAMIKVLPSKREQVVLLHIEPENVFSTTYDGGDIKSLLVKYNRNEIIASEIDKLDHNSILQRFYWSLSYNGKVLGIVKNFLKPNYDYKKYSGYDPIYVSKSQNEIFTKILKQEKNPTCLKDLEINKIYEDLLDELKLYCDNNNKTLILFTSPSLEDNCKDDNVILKEILNTKGVTYHDFSDFFSDDFSIDYWKDKTHLSNKGAEIFTKEIKKVVQSEKVN